MYVTLTNDFHNTETKIRWPKGMPELFLTDAQARRVGNRLCGYHCTCSGFLGTRGPQPSFEVDGSWCHVEEETWYRGDESGILLSIVED